MQFNSTQAQVDTMAALGNLPIVAETAQQPVWSQWGALWRDLYVVDRDGDLFQKFNLTDFDPDPTVNNGQNYAQIKQAFIGAQNHIDGVGSGKPLQTIGVFDPATANWYLRFDSSPGGADLQFAFGAPGMIPIGGDFLTANGREGIALYNPANGSWVLTDDGQALPAFTFGLGGQPVAFDYNGDKKDGIALFFDGTWIIGDDQVIGPISFGGPGMVPVSGDWDGDGRDGLGVFNPANATWILADGAVFTTFKFGGPNWKPVTGDWDGDGKDGIGVFDPSTANWYLSNTVVPPTLAIGPFAYGGRGWTPVVGDWNGPDALLASDEVTNANQASLNPNDLNGITEAALVRLQAAGVSPFIIDVLRQTEVRIGDLPGRQLGQAGDGVITIDATAAGHGWFVDPTPLQDEEAADGRMDLLTVVMHELGHLAGLEDRSGTDSLMADVLTPGVRRTDVVDLLFSGNHAE